MDADDNDLDSDQLNSISNEKKAEIKLSDTLDLDRERRLRFASVSSDHSSDSECNTSTRFATKPPLLQFHRIRQVPMISTRNEDLTAEEKTPAEIRERLGWQALLKSVLSGDVIRTHMKKLTYSQQQDMGNQVWLGLRALLHGKTVKEERAILEKLRAEADSIIEDILNFRVDQLSTASAYDQVVKILNSLEVVESLYPCRKYLTLEKPLCGSFAFQYNVEALNSWLAMTNSLRTQLQILKAWIGSDNLMKISHVFLDRLLKESSLQKTFGKRILSVLRGLLRKVRESMVSNAAAYDKMGLPTYSSELRTLTALPAALMEQFLQLRLEYIDKLKQNSVILDQSMEDLRSLLDLAKQVKKSYEDLNSIGLGTDLDQDWGVALSGSYDNIMLESLRMYFRLLSFRFERALESGAHDLPDDEVLGIKDVETLESEWSFLSSISVDINRGDIETAVQFSYLVSHLMDRLIFYLGSLKLGNLDSQVKMSWLRTHIKIQENVRLRSRKLLTFLRTLCGSCENASEYELNCDPLLFIHSIFQTGHVLVENDNLPENMHIFVPSTAAHKASKDLISTLLTSAFVMDKLENDGDFYAIVLNCEDRFNWMGNTISVKIEMFETEVDLKPRRVRVIATGGDKGLVETRLRVISKLQCDLIQIKDRRANVAPVHKYLKVVKEKVFLLAEAVINSAVKYRDLAVDPNSSSDQPPSSSALSFIPSRDPRVLDFIEDWFSFASDFGAKAARIISKDQATFNKKLLKLALKWVEFICADGGRDKKTFRWALMALQFTEMSTSGETILQLPELTFGELKHRVASCMALVRSYFDHQYGQLLTAEDVDKDMFKKGLSLMKALSISDLSNENYEDALDALREEWMKTLGTMELDREKKQSTQRAIGKVLNDQNIVDRNIGALAARSGSISLRWQQGKFLGGGSFGSVYMAFNLDTGDVMAVKEIRFQDVNNLDALMQSVKEEMDVLKILHHPNIVEYYGVEVYRDKLYIFMEYCPQPLSALLEHGGRIEDPNILRVHAKQILLGIEYLHAKNIVHRDVKPANLLLSQEGNIKIVDFGASKIYKPSKTWMVSGGLQNTLVGTPRYMAPEIITSDHSDNLKNRGSADIWSYGCCLYQMITGQLPWGDVETEFAVFYQVGLSYTQFGKSSYKSATPRSPISEELTANGTMGDLDDVYINSHALLKRAKQSGHITEEMLDFLGCCLRWCPDDRWTASKLLEHVYLKHVSETVAEYSTGFGDTTTTTGGTGSSLSINSNSALASFRSL